MIDFLTVILMAPPQGGKSSQTSFFLMMIMIFVVFYFFMIRPQMRKQKELKNFREALKKGDRIITTGGIYGKINNISDNIVTIDVGNNVLIKIDKSAVLKDSHDIEQPQK